jgi:hypothetical protein
VQTLITLLLGGIISAAPYFFPIIPAPYNAIATGIIATLTGIYHLYQPMPSK